MCIVYTIDDTVLLLLVYSVSVTVSVNCYVSVTGVVLLLVLVNIYTSVVYKYNSQELPGWHWFWVSQLGLMVRCSASINGRTQVWLTASAHLSLKTCWSMDTVLWLPCTVNQTLKWLTTLPIHILNVEIILMVNRQWDVIALEQLTSHIEQAHVHNRDLSHLR